MSATTGNAARTFQAAQSANRLAPDSTLFACRKCGASSVGTATAGNIARWKAAHAQCVPACGKCGRAATLSPVDAEDFVIRDEIAAELLAVRHLCRDCVRG